MRLDIRRTGAIKSGEDVIGSRTRVKVVKNKLAPPFREAEFDIIYGEGISQAGEVVDLGADKSIIEKAAPGIPTKGSGSGRAGKMPKVSARKS